MKEKICRYLGAILFVLEFHAAGLQAATVTLGGYTFDTTAFPTSAALLSGGPASFSFPTTGSVNSDILSATDSNLTSYMYGTPISFTLTFGNAPIQNTAGADLVIFELGTPDDVTVKVNAVSKTYLTINTGFTAASFNLNAIAIDLSDFAVPLNGTIGTIELNNISPVTGSASIDAIGALHTANPPQTPEPGTLLTLGGGLAAAGLLGRRRRKPGPRE